MLPRLPVRTRPPNTRNFLSPRATSPGHWLFPSISHRASNPGATLDSLESYRCSRSPAMLRKRSLLQMMSPLSGRKMSMGRGALVTESLVACSTLPVTLSRYFWMAFCRVRRLRLS